MTEFLRTRKGKVVIGGTAVLLIAVTVIIFLLAGGETGYRNIAIFKIFGSVTAENNGNTYKAYENMRLAGGYALNTGRDSYTRLSFDDDKYMKLEQESRAEFNNVGDAKNHVTSIYLDHSALTAELVNPLEEEEAGLVTNEGEADPNTGSSSDIMADPGDNLPDSGDVPVEPVLALARGRPP